MIAGFLLGWAAGRAHERALADGGWTPTHENDMCVGGHPPVAVTRGQCGRCGRLVDERPCGCGSLGHDDLSRSMCPVMVSLDQHTVNLRKRRLAHITDER